MIMVSKNRMINENLITDVLYRTDKVLEVFFVGGSTSATFSGEEAQALWSWLQSKATYTAAVPKNPPPSKAKREK